MKKSICVFLISFFFGFANENVVKTSELELFLFKIGFESLLKDVDITKDKSNLNEDEIKKINEKVELIMNELYKNDRVLLNDSTEKQASNSGVNKQIVQLKKEIDFLKKEMVKLRKDSKKIEKLDAEIKKIKDRKNEKNEEVIIKEKTNIKIKENKKLARVASEYIAIYTKPITDSKVLRKVTRGTFLEIDTCKYGWCSLKNEKGYVRKFLIKEHE